MVTWTIAARKSLKKIHEYIATDSHYYANKLVASIIAKGESLDKFPQMGRIVPEFSDDSVREVYVSPYRILYQVSSNDVKILNVLHGKRDLENAFKEKDQQTQ
ncbi:MAG TPA: type II toxin-antitoxin system RelE/ParE family toxin [Spirochaetota bacterium]|mgnify:CR=1 FL=1|nr:type II toxin-antitoxin system RelE/ParE family toxin [Spirochaetota bacterium]HPC43469.1 type II toxin-antitoxin system RelE/ParE family toxin [Spirochaetota bacterium]HPL17274.1 type II toxin-antitoxin system RelE/ParE family toxin [Spirochaetota bacterium]HQF06933.1 type II toxin-antitoxin system RelE/ParE family toxin [Spirochaetota bacterium]HQH95448.1 type II toxin-antitoxin system RelE/ParE family toxin [Spirochaetota bacterium]